MSTRVSVCNETMYNSGTKAVRLLSPMIALFLVLPLFSQTSQGTIQGGVFDQTGGAVAGATVTVVDVARGLTRNLVSDDAGQYVAINLNPGTYTVRGEAKGFRATEHSGVLVEVGQTIRVDLTLQPGEQTQTITVTEEVAAINTTDATLGGTVNNLAVNALPLNGRNFERLVQLRPGVVIAVGAGQGSTNTNGRRSGEDLLLVEGIASISQTEGYTTLNSVYRGGDSSSLLPIDAIQEFNTQQNPKAEYGWKDGTVINVGIKSGTNTLHGTAYAFGRDADATDAANYFSGAVTPATLEQFGASAGGPVLKDKLFWFVSYEGLRDTLGDVSVDTIPTDVAGLGSGISMVDACNALKATGKTISPLSAQLSGLNTTTCAVTASSPTNENLFPYLPSTTSNLFAPGLISIGPLNNGIFKGDYAAGPHHHLSGIFYDSRSTTVNNYMTGELEPQWEVVIPEHVEMYGGGWTWTPNSTWVNDFRLGYSFLQDYTNPGDASVPISAPWPTGYGLNTGVTNPAPQYGGLPYITISTFTGYLGEGPRVSRRGPEGNVDLVDNVSFLRGKHAFMFGLEYMDIVFEGDTADYSPGQIKFSNLENFLQGIPSGGVIQAGNPAFNARAHWYGAFAQDDWRLSTRLTLNLGIRYEYEAPLTEHNNFLGNFNPDVNPATTSPLQQVGPGAPLAAMYNDNKFNFFPRVGLAWDIKGNGMTVLRAGVGLIGSPAILENYISNTAFGANVPSAGVNNSGTAINANTPDELSLAGSQLNWTLAGPVFPINNSQTINGATYTGITCTVAVPCSTGSVNPNIREPYTVEWNLDIQRVLTKDLTLDVAYVGNRAYDQVIWSDVNQPPLGAGWNNPNALLPGGVSPASYCIASAPAYTNCLTNSSVKTALTANETAARPYEGIFPYLSYITQVGNGAYGNYNALQVTANERLFHGFSFLSGYTYSHSLDVITSQSHSQPIAPNGNNFSELYGNGDADLRHRFTFSPSYAIPGLKSPGQMLQGWAVSGILTLQSGLPWWPSDTTSDILGTGEYDDTTIITGAFEPWNYTGPRSAFSSGPISIPCFGTMSGCTPYPLVGGVPQLPAACVGAATAPYAGNAQLQSLALAALTNLGCYVQGSGVLTPPAYGTIGDASRNLFRSPSFYNLDLSLSKMWVFKERYSAQFRAEFFNIFNRADFTTPGVVNPESGAGGQFGCSCLTPDSTNPVLGSGGPRHIQFGLKLTF